jgi:hypothetical protein
MSSREKTQADFDLEAFIDLFDEALTSDDPSVQKTLQHLMVIAALARNHSRHNERIGPLRQLFDDQRNIIRRLDRLESDKQRIYPGGGLGGGGGGMPFGPYVHPTTVPNTGGGTGWPPQTGAYPPGTLWAQNKTATSMTLDPGFGAIPTTPAKSMVVEHVGDLLKSDYKGSSVGTKNVKIT